MPSGSQRWHQLCRLTGCLSVLQVIKCTQADNAWQYHPQSTTTGLSCSSQPADNAEQDCFRQIMKQQDTATRLLNFYCYNLITDSQQRVDFQWWGEIAKTSHYFGNSLAHLTVSLCLPWTYVQTAVNINGLHVMQEVNKWTSSGQARNCKHSVCLLCVLAIISW